MNEALQNLEIKVENGGSTPQGRVSAAEWNVLVAGVKALDLAGFDEAALRDYLDQYDYITRPELDKALEGIGGGSGSGIAYPLTWSGYSQGMWDGSASANIDIPSLMSQLTNDIGYIKDVSSDMIVAALGYTPYDSTNPSGYITSSALTPYAKTTDVNSLLTDYLPKSGGSVNGNISATTFLPTGNITMQFPNGEYFDKFGNLYFSKKSGAWSVVHPSGENLFIVYVAGYVEVIGDFFATGEIAQHSSLVLKDVVDTRFLTLKELVALKPYSFRWKDKRDDKLHAGAVADYVKPILPEVISTDKDNIHSMNYANAAWVVGTSLTPYVSKHEEEIERLKSRVKYLEGKLKA